MQQEECPETGDSHEGEPDGHRTALSRRRDASVEHPGVAVPADLGDGDRDDHGEGGDLRAAGRSSQAAADEHGEVRHQPSVRLHVGDVD